MIKEKFAKLIDMKSIITISVIFVVELLVVYTTVCGKDISSNAFVLFSNIATMIVTYYFTKKKDGDQNEQRQN